MTTSEECMLNDTLITTEGRVINPRELSSKEISFMLINESI